jgi:adenine-specific DNA-methyltransferase
MHSSLTRPLVDLSAITDQTRLRVSAEIAAARKSELGQFFTPSPVARLMASMLDMSRETVRFLDPGAGIGSLTAAWVEAICAMQDPPGEVTLVPVEQDATLLPALRATMDACEAACERANIVCTVEIQHADFIASSVELLDSGLWREPPATFDVAILNPPYRKLRTDSHARQLLRRIDLDTTNLYSAFLSLVIRRLSDNGEFVAITPRSFCNGPYFRRFRKQLLRSMSLSRLHIFESRLAAFSDDDVLQENVIMHARKADSQQPIVQLTRSSGPLDSEIVLQSVPFGQVVLPHDRESFIHFALDDHERAAAELVRSLPCTLVELELKVSTGRVVDFRSRAHLRSMPDDETQPLLYSVHFSSGRVQWPKPASKKPNAIVHHPETADLLVPKGHYVLVKRFSSKEEKRRVVAVVLDPNDVPGNWVGLENHLNYFHASGKPLSAELAAGLNVFLNSTIVDTYFRQFNGHTQVNATDLRMLRYPSRGMLISMGRRAQTMEHTQEAIDRLMDDALSVMTE